MTAPRQAVRSPRSEGATHSLARHGKDRRWGGGRAGGPRQQGWWRTVGSVVLRPVVAEWALLAGKTEFLPTEPERRWKPTNLAGRHLIGGH